MTEAQDKNAEPEAPSALSVTLPQPPPQELIELDRINEFDVTALQRLAKDRKEIVEIGTFLGGSGLTLIGAMPDDGRLVTIDSYTATPAYFRKGDMNQQLVVYSMMRLRSHLDRITFIVGDSVEVASCFAENRFDMVFIDGAHDYDSVMADIRAWTPKVKDGGIVAGHDFDQHVRFLSKSYVAAHKHQDYDLDTSCHIGVGVAVHECFDKINCFGDIDSSVWWSSKDSFRL